MPGPSVSLLSWLRPEHIEVAYGGAIWHLSAHTAADWLGAIANDFDGLTGVFPGLIDDGELEDMLMLLRDNPPSGGFTEVARKVVGAAGGRDWWWTVNLARSALNRWIYLNGILVRQGVRSDGIGLPDWLDACYTLLWERCDENEKIALDIELCFPPPGVSVGGKQKKQMLAAFAAD